MGQDRRQRLIALGKEALADALLELAERDESADDLVKRMTATPGENLRRFKAKLAALKRSRRFLRWGESGALAARLRLLLQDLQAGVKDPVIGTEMIAAFYETDKGVLGHCDDSSGLVGDVFRHDATALFVGYAQDCADKERLARLLFDVLGSLGNIEKQTDVAWRIFRRHRGKGALEDLLTVIGNDRREAVIHGEVAAHSAFPLCYAH